jgi:hypothetical protein
MLNHLGAKLFDLLRALSRGGRSFHSMTLSSVNVFPT